MTDTDDTPSCGFKIGKYLLEGTAYKNALIRLIDEQVEEGGVLNLTIIFFDGYYTERNGFYNRDKRGLQEGRHTARRNKKQMYK